MKVTEMRGKDTRELSLDLHELRKEAFNMRFRAASEEVAKTDRFREIRRTVARIKTVLRQRQIEEQQKQAAKGTEA
jgi:large subunit ribosomal protein L29